MNQVDTTPETVEKEWMKISENFGVSLDSESGHNEENAGGSQGENGDVREVKKLGKHILPPEEFDMKSEMVSKWIETSLAGVFSLLKLSIHQEVLRDFSSTWAVVIVNRFPERPEFEFMDRYGDMIAAGGATLVLFGAVGEARKNRKAIESNIKQQLEVNQKEMQGGEE